MKKHLREIAGFILIGIGLIGFLIPIMPSVPFILAGIGLIGVEHPRLKPLIDKLKTIKGRFSENPSNKQIIEQQEVTSTAQDSSLSKKS